MKMKTCREPIAYWNIPIRFFKICLFLNGIDFVVIVGFGILFYDCNSKQVRPIAIEAWQFRSSGVQFTHSL